MRSIKNILLSILLLVLIPAALHAEKITFLTPSWGAPPDKALLESFQKETGITVEIQSVQNKDLFRKVPTPKYSPVEGAALMANISKDIQPPS